MALNAANGARLLVEREIEAGNEGAERRIDGRHACARIRRAADDLLDPVNCLDGADAQLVGVRMRLCLDHLADGERGKLLARVNHLFDLKARLEHQIQNVLKRRLGDQVIVQPGK